MHGNGQERVGCFELGVRKPSRGSRVLRMLGFKSSGNRTKEQTCSAYKVEVGIVCPVNWLTLNENVAS